MAKVTGTGIIAMSNEEKEFDEEFHRAFSEIAELRRTVSELKAELAAHEKRELLRVRGNQYCRQCKAGGAEINPPLTEAERIYHETNHITGTQADPSRRLSGYGAHADWNMVEKQFADIKKASGRG